MTATEAYTFFDLLLDKTGSAAFETADKQQFMIEAADELINTERKRLGENVGNSEKIRSLLSLKESTGSTGSGAYSDYIVHAITADIKYIVNGYSKSRAESVSVRPLHELFNLHGQAFVNYVYVGEVAITDPYFGTEMVFNIIKNPTFNWVAGEFVDLSEQGQRDLIKIAVRLASVATEDPRYQAYDKEEQE